MRFTQYLVAVATAASAASIPKYHSKGVSKRAPSANGSLEFWGINESGAEFGNQNLPGVYGTDYTWYDLNTVDTFISQGVNLFRLNLQMERLTPSGLTGPLDPAYSGNLTQQINYITGKGAYAMITPHNYGRYNNAIITDTAGFGTWWKTVATPYASNSKVIFDTNNEYHDMDQTLVVNLNQAAIDGIRAAGATSQYITPEGNAYTGAWTWTQTINGANNGATLGALTDSGNKLIYQMHQYLDSDGSGTSTTCVSNTIFQERLVAATQWLRDNNKVGIIGEFAGGVNSECETSLRGGLDYLVTNSDVWRGAAFWSAGPWWSDYIFSAEPSSGVAYSLFQSLSSTYGV
ncbi:MAG: hypothetical protein M1820_006226 [Bogoriella megaspora]|nr:MAG: hypothetical protein M1820_006226 [Bogoriella megaspora]